MTVKEIWIESESKGAIIGGELEVNDNSDIIVTFEDDSKYVATFFTYDNIEFLRKKNRKTGECLNGKYFWASDMLLVDKINREEVERIVCYLIEEQEFNSVFNEI